MMQILLLPLQWTIIIRQHCPQWHPTTTCTKDINLFPWWKRIRKPMTKWVQKNLCEDWDPGQVLQSNWSSSTWDFSQYHLQHLGKQKHTTEPPWYHNHFLPQEQGQKKDCWKYRSIIDHIFLNCIITSKTFGSTVWFKTRLQHKTHSICC